MDKQQLELRLRGNTRRPGYNTLTVFFGAWSESTAASLDDGARQGALLLYIYDGYARAEADRRECLFFHAPAVECELTPLFRQLCEAYGIEEGFQINTISQNGYEHLPQRLIPLFHQILSGVKFSRHIGLLHLRCMLRNIPALAGGGRLTARQRHRKAAAVVCGAGPSLVSQLEQLRELRDRVWVISVGHAAVRLADHGIQPDLVVEIDAESGRNWRRGLDLACPLAAVPIVAPEVTGHFSRFMWYGEPERENCAFLRGLGIDLPAIAVSCGVIITAIDIAFQIGFDHVGLIGSDLCLADNGSMYGDGASVAGGTVLPGNLGGTVVSLPALTGIRDALETYIAEHRRTVCNCTNGGAVIRGARWLPLTEFAKLAEHPPQVEFFPEPHHPAAERLAASWRRMLAGGEPDATAAWLLARQERFVAQVDADALSPGKLSTLPPYLLEDIDRDIEGDQGGAMAGPYRFAAFRRHAIDTVRLHNPQYAEWLENGDKQPPDTRFEVRSWLETLPDVRLTATGQPLTPGDNREHAAREALEQFLQENNFDRQRHLPVFVAPGNWLEVVQFARGWPGTPFVVLDPFPELFSRLIDYALFCHYFPAEAVIVGIHPELTRWKRLYHGVCREAARQGKSLLFRAHPALADHPEVKQASGDL